MTTIEQQNYLEFINAITKNTYMDKIKSKISSFSKTLYKKLNADISEVKLYRVYNLKTIKEFLKVKSLDNVYLLVVLEEFGSNKVVLTDFNSKNKIDSLGYCGYKKVTLKRYLNQEAPVFIVYANKTSQEKISELVQKRKQRKENSYLDLNSVLYRSRDRYEIKDSSGYIRDINKFHKKFCEKLLTKDINYLINYISEKETNLHRLYIETRNRILRDKPNNINLQGYSIYSFAYELSYMTTAFYNLQNSNLIAANYYKENTERNIEEYKQQLEKYNKSEFIRNFIEIIEKEEYFKTNIKRFIKMNNR